MKKTLIAIASLSLLISSCSKSGGGGGGSTKPTSKTVHFMRIKHKGKMMYIADTAYYSYTGVIVPPTTITASILSSGVNEVLIQASSPNINLGFFGEKKGTVLGEYTVHDGPTQFIYNLDGENYSKYFHQNEAKISKINITTIDDSSIVGTAYLLVTDSTIAEIEFNAKPRF